MTHVVSINTFFSCSIYLLSFNCSLLKRIACIYFCFVMHVSCLLFVLYYYKLQTSLVKNEFKFNMQYDMTPQSMARQ